MKPEVEFFSEKIDDIEYLNVGLKWEDKNGTQLQAVLGAFRGEVSQEAMVIIKGLVEQAVMYVLGIEDE